jgi:hypothetical protein
MKKVLYYLLGIILISSGVKAANGDTTWVQAHSDVWLTGPPTNYDTLIQFPDGTKSYRKIYMIFTLGKYQCPGSPQYCGDWDYTVQNYLMTKGGDTIELSRLITPYANSGAARTPPTWKERYVFDVTDYYPLLKDSATARIHYSGWTGGFTANIRFAFIEGTPVRNVLGIERLWHGSWGFGNTAPIDDNLPAVTTTAPANTQSAELKFRVTGHGSDGSGCSEFCKKYYQVLVNGNMIEQKDIWRDNCGLNHLYPQSGTWLYDRGNWCPGDLVQTNSHLLTGIAGGSNYNVDVNFEPYSGSGSASYTIESAIVYYGGINKTLDASIEDIIAPNDHEMYYRQNPLSGNPVIKVKNTGSTPITSLNFAYGIQGGFMAYYLWNGTLNPMEEALITLPEFWELRVATGTNMFTVSLININNATSDDDISNNSLSCSFKAAPAWPNAITIKMTTNKGQASNSHSETNWYLIEGGKDTIARRVDNDISKAYLDTVILGPSFYQFVVMDGGCDGLSFWNNSSAGSGNLLIRNLATGASLPLTGYFNGDFGCGFTQYFNVNWPAAISNINIDNRAGIDAYPNPASGIVNINISGNKNVKGVINVIDGMGRVVLQQNCNESVTTINTDVLLNGVYTVVFIDERANNAKLQTRLVIAK